MVLPVIAIVLIAGLAAGVVGAEVYIFRDIFHLYTGKRTPSDVPREPYSKNGPGGRWDGTV